MEQRRWDAKIKAMLVIEGLQGKPMAELCTEQQISQSQYYQGCDQWWANASTADEVQQQHQREAYLTREYARLRDIVGDLT